MDEKMIKLIIFDLWRTLIPATIDFTHLFSLLKKEGISRGEFIERYEKATQFKDYKVFEDLRKDFFEEFKEQSNSDLEQELYEIYFNRFDKIYFFSDVVPVLKKLKKKGYKIALLSNTESFIRKPLEEKLDAKKYIDFFGYSFKLNALKPSKEAFQKVLDNFKVSSQEALMVGDSLRSDVQGANNMNMHSCWLNRDNLNLDSANVKPEFEIKSLTELDKVLGVLNGQSK